jgi:hypothetical protein
MLAPLGIVTRTAAPLPLPHAAVASESASADARAIRLTGKLQRMLEKHRRRHGVDVALSAFG